MLKYIKSLFKKKQKQNETLKKFWKEETNRQNKKKQKLLRFTRGNKTLTPEQQTELFHINAENIKKLRQLWKNEHL